MWTHPKTKKLYVGNYEMVPVARWEKYFSRQLRLENRNSKGKTVGKVFTFSSASAAKKAGWFYNTRR